MSASAGPPPGFYDHGGGARRWWDGAGWTDRYEARAVRIEELSAAERRGILDRAVATYVGHGYSQRFNDGTRAVVSRRQRLNVPLNLLLTVVTGGLWLVVLALRLLDWPIDRVALTVDAYGVLTPQFS